MAYFDAPREIAIAFLNANTAAAEVVSAQAGLFDENTDVVNLFLKTQQEIFLNSVEGIEGYIAERGLAVQLNATVEERQVQENPSQPVQQAGPPVPPAQEKACPVCRGAMWDNTVDKRNPRAPDYKCKDKSCEGVIWPPRGR